MTLTPDDDLAAAEYALGTLDPGERAGLAARRLREPELDAAIRAWEARLSPLAEAAPPLEPPSDYLAAIEARIRAASPGSPAAPSDAIVLALRRSASRWRAAAIGAASLAAMLAIGVVFRETTREGVPHEYVAVLQKDASSPAFAVTVNLDSREFTVRPVAAPAASGKSYELWLINDKLGAPRSLGVIDAAGATRAGKLAGFDRGVVEQATYAVTLEPPGGSPDGKPSGAPVFVGKLIPVGP
jgi:anti-sigma-K factor RskA